MLTITHRATKGSLKFSKRKVMIISARVHAGETHSSFVMRYLLKELTSGNSKYDYLLDNYIIKLIPMINVDGVIVGNSRGSLVGLDLNR